MGYVAAAYCYLDVHSASSYFFFGGDHRALISQIGYNVTVMAKKVVGIGGGVQYIMVGGTNLSDAAKQTKLLTINKHVDTIIISWFLLIKSLI